jgi:Protein of unknown function (DUF1376)
VSLSPPLVPHNVDLRSMPEMPLDVALLRDASIIDAITDQSFKAAVLLWAVSWHQVPAGSLPDDNVALARWTGFGKHVSEWLEIREHALWKFVKCSDGRLYHPIIAKKAIRVWEYRESYRRRMEAARNAKAGKGNIGKPKSVTGSVTGSVIDPVSRLNQTKPNSLKNPLCSTSVGAEPKGNQGLKAIGMVLSDELRGRMKLT